MARFLGKKTALDSREIHGYYTTGKACDSTVTIFILERWAELVKSGFCSANYFPNFVEQRIIYLMVENTVVAALVFAFHNKTSFLEFVVTHPEYRKTGLYKVLHTFYDQIVKEEGVKVTRSQLHVDNENVIKAATKNGFAIEYYRMIKKHG